MTEHNVCGLVFNIQKFSYHDGPGIRTTVFFKGCPLRCGWCSNPESQTSYPVIMIDGKKCIGCGKCMATCPTQAVSFGDGVRLMDWSKCTQCCNCADVCPSSEIVKKGEEYDLERLLTIIKQDEVYYEFSGGGVTFSGGEPLMQAEFIAELARRCKEDGISTCLDTSGYADWSDIEKVLPNIDLVLFDIKHIDPESHKQGTGVDNSLIIENLRRIAESTRVWIRVPLIPHFNDDECTLRQVAELAKEIGAERVTVMPYHTYGVEKYARLGRSYPGVDIEKHSDSEVEQALAVLEGSGIYTTKA